MTYLHLCYIPSDAKLGLHDVVYLQFGKHWFNPKEASSLRPNIWGLLKEKFKNASQEKQVLDL